MRRSDEAAYRAHLLRLDQQTRRGRFGHGVSDDFLSDYAARTIASEATLHGYFEDGLLRGVAELHPLGSMDVATAEAAFSVEPGWQGRGIGSMLMERILSTACARGISRVIVTCQASNRTMRRLATGFAAELEIIGDEVMGQMTTPRPTAFTYAREAIEEGYDFATALMDATWPMRPKSS
ncbi:GNAT family N-acetyltransferase [Amorphus orientalis]|uniref:GNAT superfamily N-acetyltransferase n=1 Tax=Amorphus orientalis TaxID=649198 RepID=A0AAE3VLL2_9HYPH|nr:GNAT family N-acetyltransferase [Amorphus orientalis]MDQ0314198.1 GNAT superfamily N-acetyltransferase [Amorphus orientalis]